MKKMVENANLTKKRWHYYTNWSKFDAFFLTLTLAKELTNVTAIHKIEELVQKLTQVPNVKKARAIALKFPDIHWIDFELELQPKTELSHEEWENVQNLVIDYEWKLRDDSGEEWYFRPQIVDKFYAIGDAKIADSDKKNINLLL